MSTADWLLDALLALTLLWLGWQVLTSRDLFMEIVFFIAFGLVMALSWVRLEAPDVALAEAAVGAGLTGALFLGALSRLERLGETATADSDAGNPGSSSPARPRFGMRLLLGGLSAVFLVGLGASVLSLPGEAPGLSLQVAQNLDVSGVGNPVTAVLLNFRAYDTLLEKGVLFLAIVAVWSLTAAPEEPVSPPGSVLKALVRLLLPIMLLVASYLLWVGAHAPGGAFQAGAVLAAATVLALLSGRSVKLTWQGWPLRVVLSLGLAVFVAAGLAVMFAGYRFLEYPPTQAGNFILLIEVTATLSIGVTLAALFLGGRPPQGERE